MTDAGQLERVDAAVVARLRATAGLADAALNDPEESRFVITRTLAEYGAALAELRALAPVGADALDELIASLSAPLGDTPDS